MEIGMEDGIEDGNVYSTHKTAEFNNCANCNSKFDKESQKVTKIDLCEGTAMSKVYILDALMYVYGLNISDFNKPFQNDKDDPNISRTIDDNFHDSVTDDDTALCCHCCPVFLTLYDVHKKFNKMSSEDSLLQRTINYKRRKTKGTLYLKVEGENSFEIDTPENDVSCWKNKDDSNCNDEYSNSFTEKHAILTENFDGCKDDIFDNLKSHTQHHINEMDIKNIDLINEDVLQNDHLVKRKRGRPKKIKIAIKTPTFNGVKSRDKLTTYKAQPTKRVARSNVLKMESQTWTTKVSSSKNESGSSNADNFTVGVRMSKTGPGYKSKNNRVPPQSSRFTRQRKIKLKSSTVKSEVSVSHVSGIHPDNPEFLPESSDEKEVNTERVGFIKIGHSEGKRKVYLCNICGEAMSRIKKYQVHMNSHKKSEKKEKEEGKNMKVKCSFCDKLLNNEMSLKVHERIHHCRESFSCDKCGKCFTKANAFKLHQQFSHTEDKQFECKVCGMRYKWKGSLQCHELTHKIPRPHVCEKCGMSFANKSNFNRHRTYHEDEDQQNKDLFKCSECGKHLKNRKSLKKHIDAFHRPGMQKMFTCDICGKTTKTSFNLRLHRKIHDPNRIQKRRARPSISNSTAITEKSCNPEVVVEELEEPLQICQQQPSLLWC